MTNAANLEPKLEEQVPKYAGVKLTIENCLLTPEEIAASPSQEDGITAEEESRLRHLGCEFIQIAGISLRVPQFAVANAQVLFQRFYCIKSFVKNKMEEVAMACIWLASKIEEAPRRIRDVINVFHMFKQKLEDPKAEITVMQLDGSYSDLKQRVIKYERRLLKELGFCVHVKHPHKVIIVFLQVLKLETNVDLVQVSWNYMNDSMRTTMFVQYSPEAIACACICLAAYLLEVPTPTNPHWAIMFDATEENLKEIILALMKIYHERKQIKVSMATSIVDKLKQANMKPEELAAAALANASASNTPSSTTQEPAKGEESAERKNGIEAVTSGESGSGNKSKAGEEKMDVGASTSASSKNETSEHKHERRKDRHSHRRDHNHSRSRSSRDGGKHSKHSRRRRDRDHEKKRR